MTSPRMFSALYPIIPLALAAAVCLAPAQLVAKAEVVPLSFREQVESELKIATDLLSRTSHTYVPPQPNENYIRAGENDYVRESLGNLKRSLLLAKGQSQQDLSSKLRDAITKLEEMLGRRTLAEFRVQLEHEIRWAIKQEQDSSALKSLLQAADCVRDNGPSVRARNMLSELFDQLFRSFSEKPRLTQHDCLALQNAHMLWSSFYESSNDAVRNASRPTSEKIPLYNVNAHNSTVFYWLKEMSSGRIPEGGLPLLHADTHTDLGHIHDHLTGSHWAHRMDVSEIGKAIRLSDKSQLREHLLTTVIPKLASLEEVGRAQAAKQIAALDPAELQSQIENSMRERVHRIAQPILGAVATGMANKVIMCLPPWSKHMMKRSVVKRNGDVVLEENFLVRSQNTLALRDQPNLAYLKFRGEESEKLATIPMGALDCNSEVRNEDTGNVTVESRDKLGIPDLKKFFSKEDVKKGFILDIDLDVFVSEGRPQNAFAEPISHARTRQHNRLMGKHGGHDEGTETDPTIYASAKELRLIQGRIDQFFDQLKDAKSNGILPKVITIADSTLLERAFDTSRSDAANGGNYTPECLAFLVNYKVRKKLAELYPIQQEE